MQIIFNVSGIPKGQPRVRAYRRGERAGVYDPGTANSWKGLIAMAARPYLPPVPIEQPVKITIHYYLPRPKRLMRKSDTECPVPHTGRPDIDNLDKAVLDILTNIKMWRDDSLICEKNSLKYYHSKSGRPHATIKITTI